VKKPINGRKQVFQESNLDPPFHKCSAQPTGQEGSLFINGGLNIYISFKEIIFLGLNSFIKIIYFGGPKDRAWVA
jgi:hypothetical protein